MGGHDGFNGALFSNAGRNHLRYGYRVTRLGVVLNFQLAQPEELIYYTHHPPLLPVLVSLSFRVFGEHEWAARLVPVSFSLGSLLLVYLFGVELGGRPLGLLAAFFFALLPMNAFYGRMVGHEAPTNFFALASALSYVRWHRRRHARQLALSLGLLVLGAGSGWPAYYLAAILPLHHLVASERGQRDWRVILYPLTAFALFGLFLGHVSMLRGGRGLSDLGMRFLQRAGWATVGDVPLHVQRALTYSWWDFLRIWRARAWGLFTPLVLLLAIAALWERIRGRLLERRFIGFFPLWLLLFGVTHLALFPQGAWVHDYWAFYCAAPVALLAASGLQSLARPMGDRRVLVVFILLFLGTALPEIRARHSEDVQPMVLVLSRLLREHTGSDEVFLTNDDRLKSPPVRYYAGRDTFSWPETTVPALERAIGARGRRLRVFLLAEDGPGAAELGPWLSLRFPAQEVTWEGKRYRIFRIAADKAS